MADSVQTLIDEVITVVDVSPAEALTALNRAHRKMVARALSYRKRLSIGPTVAGTAFYAAPGVVELFAIEVDGVPYGKARRPDIYGYSQGHLVWTGDAGGLIVADASSGAADGLTLIPTPDTSGLTIEIFAALLPVDLTADGAASTIRVDADFYDALVDRATSVYLRRQGEGDPASLDAAFDAQCEELRRRVARRFRGPGPAQIRVQGVNA